MPKGFHHLTRDQRCQISTLISMNSSQTFISEKLGVHRSTISRELRRNKGKRIYQYA
jgi:IS30 family transposase